MSDLVVIVYPTQEKAEEVRKRLFELQKEYIIKLAVGFATVGASTLFAGYCVLQVRNLTSGGCYFVSAMPGIFGLGNCLIPDQTPRVASQTPHPENGAPAMLKEIVSIWIFGTE